VKSNVIKPILVASALGLGIFGFTIDARATLLVSASVGGAPNGANYVNFDNLPLGNGAGVSGGVGVTFTSGDAAAVAGALVNRYAAPYLSNGNGASFGDFSNGPDTTNYLSTGIGSVTLTFSTDHHYLGLLWGSVDGYNTLSFYDGANLVGLITGADVWASANGDQGVNGSYYANITSDIPFDSVVASSSNYAFEFDNVAYVSEAGTNGANPPANVPEPSALALFCTAVLGFVGLGRTRRRRARA